MTARRRRLHRRRPLLGRLALSLSAAGGALALAAALSCAWSRRIDTTVLEVEVPALPQAFEGWRILQISDLHATRFGPGQRDLLAAVDAVGADAVALTGDILDRGTRDIAPLLDLARELVRRGPVLAVTGNHEGGSRRGPALMHGLRAAGVEVLADRSVVLEHGADRLRVAGIDDPRVHGGPPSSQVSPTVDHRLAASGLRRAGLPVRDDVPTVLLAHRPELLDVYVAHGVDLVLTGHAHGGQWRAPGIGGLYAPNQGILPALTAGVHVRGRTRMVISRGLKVRRHLPRIGNRPELVVVVLRRAPERPAR